MDLLVSWALRIHPISTEMQAVLYNVYQTMPTYAIECTIDPLYRQHILDGIKTVECRLLKDKWLSLYQAWCKRTSRDVFQLHIHGTTHVKTIQDMTTFTSFHEMLTHYHSLGILKRVLPDKSTVADAVAQYRTWYAEKDECIYGVVAISM